MTVWAVEVNGRAVLAVADEHRLDAEADLEPNGVIASDLSVLTDPSGAPLWDGKSELILREAESEEQAVWDKGVAEAILEGEVESREEAQEDGYVVFLVPAIDPTDEDIDDM